MILADVVINQLPIFLKVLAIINIVFMNVLGLFYLNQVFYLIGSVFMPKIKYKETNKRFNYAFVISARNEETVIGELIDSIKKQDYPKELINIFVVADNCTDETAKIAKEHNVFVFERNDKSKIGKSYALDYAFKRIINEYDYLNIDAFIVFDADNLLKKNFTIEITKAFALGYPVVTGYRAPKNFSDSWISGGSSYMYLRECREVHRVRANIKSGTYISGTGFLIDKKLIEKDNGWKYHTLVEDIELSTDLAANNQTIAYCEDAIFYDEQPITVRDSCRQRLRWCRGVHQVFGKYNNHLFKSMFKKFNFAKWDMYVHVFPLPAIAFFWMILYCILGGTYCMINKTGFDYYASTILIKASENLFGPFALGLINGLLIMIQTWKTVKAKWYKKLLYAILFPLFMFLYIPLTVIALFKNVKWSEVKHTRKINIDDI